MEKDFLLLGNSLEQWITALTLSISIWLGLSYLRKIVIAKLRNSSLHRPLLIFMQNIFIKMHSYFIFTLAFFFGSMSLDLGLKGTLMIEKIATAVIIVQGGLWLDYLMTSLIEASGVKDRVESLLAKGAVNTVAKISRFTLWVLITILFLGNLGFQVGPLIAGLGIGGIAIALGVQNTLQDIAASLSILIDKPFMVGDFIIIDSFMGTVACIGIKTTRINSLTGEQIVFSNNDLLKSRIRNYKKMVERRILFSFHIPYDTASERVEKIPGIVKKIIETKETARFDRAHLKQFGEYAFEFEVVYFVLRPDYNAYMDLQQEINFQLIQEFENQGIHFAFPKHSVILTNPKAEKIYTI